MSVYPTTVWLGDNECAAEVHYYVETVEPEECGHGAVAGDKYVVIDKIMLFPNEAAEQLLVTEIEMSIGREKADFAAFYGAAALHGNEREL